MKPLFYSSCEKNQKEHGCARKSFFPSKQKLRHLYCKNKIVIIFLLFHSQFRQIIYHFLTFQKVTRSVIFIMYIKMYLFTLMFHFYFYFWYPSHFSHE